MRSTYQAFGACITKRGRRTTTMYCWPRLCCDECYSNRAKLQLQEALCLRITKMDIAVLHA